MESGQNSPLQEGTITKHQRYKGIAYAVSPQSIVRLKYPFTALARIVGQTVSVDYHFHGAHRVGIPS